MSVDQKKKLIADAKSIRADFMSGNGKANSKDSLSRQVPGIRRKLSPGQLTDMYASNAMVQNIVDIPAEDLTRAGFVIKFKDEKLKDAYESKLRQLKVKEAFKNMYSYDRLYGDGFISLGLVHDSNNSADLKTEVDPETVKKVPYINAFSNQKVVKFFVNEDMFDERYGKVEQFEVTRRKSPGEEVAVNEEETQKVHHSRLIHQQSKRLEGEHQGVSLIESLYDILTVMDTSLWSVGQILYDFSFKVFKSADVDDLTPAEKAELSSILDFKFRTEALAIIDVEEELSKESTNTGGIKDLLDYVWDYLAGAVRMPKTILKGQEAGTLTGAQYDVMNYYSRIAAIQENEMRPQLEYLMRCLMWASDECGGQLDPDTVEWSIEFNPLWNVDAKTDAEIRKLVAESDKIYIEQGVIEPGEVYESRFGRFGMTESSKFNADAADPDELAKAVYESYLKKQKEDGRG